MQTMTKPEQGAFYQKMYEATRKVLESSHSVEEYLDFCDFKIHVFLSLDANEHVDLELSCGRKALEDYGEYPEMDEYFLPFANEAISDAEFMFRHEREKALKEVREQEDYQFKHLRFL